MQTNLDQGLFPGDFHDREEAFSSNFKAPPTRTPFCKFFIGALEDFMLRLLLVCACISIVFDEAFAVDNHERMTGKLFKILITNIYLAWIEGAAIFIAVFVVAFVGSYNDYKKEEQFLKLQAISENDNTVSQFSSLLDSNSIYFMF